MDEIQKMLTKICEDIINNSISEDKIKKIK